MMPERLRRGAFYRLGQTAPYALRALEGPGPGSKRRRLAARWTGEKRPPRAGEWFLSGAIIEAYRADADLSTPYHIAEIMLLEEETVVQRTILRTLR